MMLFLLGCWTFGGNLMLLVMNAVRISCRAQPGYWSNSENVAFVHACPLPQFERCLGWNWTTNTMQCGEGYDNTTVGCAACSKHYFPEFQFCAPCPASASDVAIHISVVLLVIIGIVYGAVIAVRFGRTTPESRHDGLAQCRDFAVWALVTLQTVVQIGRRTPYGPHALTSLYSALAVVQFDSAVLAHPACYSSYPISRELQVLTASCTILVATGALFWLGRDKSPPQCCVRVFRHWLPPHLVSIPGLQHLGMLLLTLFYPLVANIAFSSLRCVNLNDELVLAANSNYHCFGPQHAPVAVLAAVALVFHVFGFPLTTFVYLRTVIARNPDRKLAASWRTAWQNYIADGSRPDMLWFAHANTVKLLVLSVVLVFGTGLSVLGECFMLVLSVVVVWCPVVTNALWFRKGLIAKWKLQLDVLTASVCTTGCFVNLMAAVGSEPVHTALSFLQFVLCLLLLASYVLAFLLRVARDTAGSLPEWIGVAHLNAHAKLQDEQGLTTPDLAVHRKRSMDSNMTDAQLSLPLLTPSVEVETDEPSVT